MPSVGSNLALRCVPPCNVWVFSFISPSPGPSCIPPFLSSRPRGAEGPRKNRIILITQDRTSRPRDPVIRGEKNDYLHTWGFCYGRLRWLCFLRVLHLSFFITCWLAKDGKGAAIQVVKLWNNYCNVTLKATKRIQWRIWWLQKYYCTASLQGKKNKWIKWVVFLPIMQFLCTRGAETRTWSNQYVLDFTDITYITYLHVYRCYKRGADV